MSTANKRQKGFMLFYSSIWGILFIVSALLIYTTYQKRAYYARINQSKIIAQMKNHLDVTGSIHKPTHGNWETDLKVKIKSLQQVIAKLNHQNQQLETQLAMLKNANLTDENQALAQKHKNSFANQTIIKSEIKRIPPEYGIKIGPYPSLKSAQDKWYSIKQIQSFHRTISGKARVKQNHAKTYDIYVGPLKTANAAFHACKTLKTIKLNCQAVHLISQ